jgi:hypothetical protein
MNFLLHRHLGARDLGSKVAGVGAMLPDLWRMADRRVRPSALLPSRVGGAPLDALLAGIEHHLAADRWFHADSVFVDGEREAIERLRDARISARRTVLFAHILWELCLDGELVRREGCDRVVTALREGIQDAGAALSESAELHHFSRVMRTPDERAAFEGRFDRIGRELARGPWIEGYQTGEGIAARIQGVRTRVGLLPMDEDDEARFADVARTLLERAGAAVDRVLAVPTFAAATRNGERHREHQ